jgi:ribosome recycling factor
MESELIDALLEDAGERMKKAVESSQHEFATVRTGRASSALLERIVVDYYGALTPLNQLATLSAPEARLLTVQPYDKSSIKFIEKAINESDIGLTPSNDGNIVRLLIPELTEEGRVKIRNVRRDVMHELRELKEAGDAGSDEEHRAEGELQKLTDSSVGTLEGVLKAKEAEILEV